MSSSVTEVKAARAIVRTRKSAYTSFIAGLVTKFNAGHAIVAVDLITLVTGLYDPVTLAMNDLGAKIDALPDDTTNYVIDNTLNGNVLTTPTGDRITAS